MILTGVNILMEFSSKSTSVDENLTFRNNLGTDPGTSCLKFTKILPAETSRTETRHGKNSISEVEMGGTYFKKDEWILEQKGRDLGTT